MEHICSEQLQRGNEEMRHNVKVTPRYCCVAKQSSLITTEVTN
jgi:hypothetical protein